MKRRSEETQYQLIAVGEDAATGLVKFESRRLLTDEEFRSYSRAVEHLLEYRESSTAFANLLNALIEFETHYSAVLSADAQLKDDREKRERAKLVLNTQLESALSTLRAFLARTQTRLSRRWGAKSEIVTHFKRVTAHEFDTTLAYRFFYKLRNYAQ